MSIKGYLSILLIILIVIVVAGFMTQSHGWSFAINGDPSKSVNSSLYEELRNSSNDQGDVTGISLELFLYYYGIYPVTSVSLDNRTYDWKSVVESADKDAYMIVEPNGSVYYNGHSTSLRNINVSTAEKPPVSTLDIEPSVLYALNAGGRDDLIHQKVNKTVIFYVDALGYYRYEDALSKGMVNNISSLGTPIEACSMYPSVTQTNAKAMMTGLGPNLTRGDFRSYIPNNDTMFDILERNGMTAVWVGGNTAPIKLNATVLNLDKNGDGSADDEVADSAIREYRAGENLVVVHFKDTDTVMHSYGPYSSEGIASVKRTDALIGRVLQALDKGTLVIVWADHGCHAVPGGGNHGTLAPEDMYVPIIIGII